MVALTSVALECAHRVAEVNLQAAKAAFAEQQAMTAVLAARELPEALASQSNLTQPATEKALAYSRQIQEIVAAGQAEFQSVIDSDYQQNSRRAQDYIAHVIRHLPACADATTAWWQSAVAAANGTFEAVKQASEMAQANIAAANSSRTSA